MILVGYSWRCKKAFIELLWRKWSEQSLWGEQENAYFYKKASYNCPQIFPNVNIEAWLIVSLH